MNIQLWGLVFSLIEVEYELSQNTSLISLLH